METVGAAKDLKNIKILTTIILILFGCLCLVAAKGLISSSEYESKLEFYELCEREQKANADMVEQYSNGGSWLDGFLSDSYADLVEDYEEMMNDTMKDITLFRIGAVVLSGMGVLLVCAGIIMQIKKDGRCKNDI